MKNFFKFLGIIALAAVIGFSMIACGETIDDPTSIIYTSYDAAGNVYKLEITKDPNRATYTPQDGDTYTLTVTNSSGTVIARSTGTVTVSGSDFTLAQADGEEIVITISSGTISTISGTIPGTSSNSEITNPTVTPNNPNAGSGGNSSGALSGTYTYTDYDGDESTITFSGSNFTYDMGEWGTITGTYTVSGTTLTLTVTAVTGFAEEFASVGDKEIWTIIDNNTLKDGEGDEWIKAGSSGNGGGNGASITTLDGIYVHENESSVIILFSDDINAFLFGSSTFQISYSIEGSTITITIIDLGGEDFTFTGTLSNDGNSITISIPDGGTLNGTYTKIISTDDDNGGTTGGGNTIPSSLVGTWTNSSYTFVFTTSSVTWDGGATTYTYSYNAATGSGRIPATGEWKYDIARSSSADTITLIPSGSSFTLTRQ